ncbi:MAG: Asp-tRNA(Asn)/Glu-tRNA(Gln) amidotransferase subunit GatB [Clostridiaceae bacterium]|nr:Asp-tRNA(Asn)/Glu-tRNA(Gln) amidotransferase subunit GatB [Clostridiaceae bacterium]MBW4860388.1 Asp-tRNA(Asn)/Glu-tRNA(Gln) amidotransferase subunit GatB [Clostridiaceae bacterium]MBW4868304.1 Asp-tRNA(Asn)/Glu-tRNA(Gln) amidotransferase subunit GatB [Clostridiaceae bacterium]
MAYKTIIGLEIHSELMTNSKIFCNCTTEFGGDVNTHCCPVCLGLPGALPVINKKVVEYGIKAGLAFNSKIARETKMDRKNYFYPDLVKGYQISQDDIPLCSGGFVEIEKKDGPKKIRIRRIHIEEDTGKSLHSEDGGSLLDYNRSGVPLIEIVTEPDMNSPEEAKEFLEKLKATLEYIEVSDVKMEEGSLRCDVNINVVDEDTGKKTSISELKNLNSFRAVVKALEYEEKRHISLLKEGKENLKETRRWDEVNNETIVMRIKEGAADYRYFPEPDLIKLEIEEEWIEDIKSNLPELPHDKKERFMKEYDLPEYDAGVLTQSKALAAFYEETVEYSKDPKQVSNWVMGDVLRRINDEELGIKDLKFTPKDLGDLLELIEEGKISNNIGKKVLRDMFDTGKSPNKIVKEKGLIQISDEGALKEIVEKVIEKNEQSVIDYKDGKDRALGFLVGQVMKETRGKANPQLANKLILEIIDEK